LILLLVDWINDELADQRIIVKSMEDDLYDGQVLQKLLGSYLHIPFSLYSSEQDFKDSQGLISCGNSEKLTGQKLEVPEVTQSEEGQRQKLRVVLGTANQILGLPRWSSQKWSVESIHSKSLVAILYLLVNLARHFRAPLRLPENVNVETVVVKVSCSLPVCFVPS
jgi:parvin